MVEGNAAAALTFLSRQAGRPGLATTPTGTGRVMTRGVAVTVAQLYLVHMLQRTLPAGFIAPCLPTKTDKLPSGSQWLHEIKHDGFRIIARKKGVQVRLYSRPGNDLTRRFPLIVDALSRLRSRSCIIDAKLSPAMTKAWPRSISSGTTAPTTRYSSTLST